MRRTRTEGATLHHIRDGNVTRLGLYSFADRYADRALADRGLTRKRETASANQRPKS
jgi:hypothetical protein